MRPGAVLVCVLLAAVVVRAEPPDPAPCAGTPAPLDATARRLVGAEQGVYVRAEDGTVLASVAADRPVHPASVTKIATTLALLEKLGPEHRFDTRVLAGGVLGNGTLRGDLVFEGGGDPIFVRENALLVLLALRDRGLGTVDGTLRTRGPFLFDWEPDPDGRRLRRVLEGRDGAEVWAAVAAARPSTPRSALADLALRFGPPARDGRAPELLLTHRSAPLIRIVKALNCYSNNVFHVFAERIGGVTAVQAATRAKVPAELRAGVRIDNAAGGGPNVRMSPRAAVALVDALAATLAGHGLALPDALPVSGADPGTLARRLADGVVVGKTGTIGSLRASALAGALRTRQWGRVTFAILNQGLAVADAQRRQDAFVVALAEAGGAMPWESPGRAVPSVAEAEIR
jgi:D-alanyl-D-alanine carboxypeptidase/D-alanyl-D-alanine-endopeptidase (penicillin-binding protein 4)